MRLRSIFDEATRNIRTGAARAGVLAVVLAALSTTLLVADLFAIGALQNRALSIHVHGGDVRVLIAKDDVDPVACAALDQLQGVTDAGAIWQRDPIQLLALPGVNVPAFEVSSGVAHLLGITGAKPGGVYIPNSLAERWLTRQGDRLETSIGVLNIAGGFAYADDDGRDPRLTNAIVVVGDDTAYASECWFSVWPPTGAADGLALGASAATGQQGTAPQIVPLNPTVGQRFDFAGDYLGRPTAPASAVAVVLAALVAFAGMQRRRLELASNLHAGAKHCDLIGVACFETALWAGFAAISAFSLSRLAARLMLAEPIPGLDIWLATTSALMVASALCGALTPVLLTSEHRLFALFKARE